MSKNKSTKRNASAKAQVEGPQPAAVSPTAKSLEEIAHADHTQAIAEENDRIRREALAPLATNPNDRDPDLGVRVPRISPTDSMMNVGANLRPATTLPESFRPDPGFAAAAAAAARRGFGR